VATPIELIINAKDNTGGAFASAGGGLAKIGQIAAGILASQVFTQLAQGAVEFGKSVFTEAMDAQSELADLDATLLSTKGIAGVTREAALSLADGLQGVTRFSDDVILSGENMLLTFTNIGQDIFPQATSALLDFATKMKQSPEQAAITLGKALQFPVEGVTALQRVGVRLTETQKDQVKAFMAVNDIASAQKIILGELNTEFGGQAVAAGKTFAGQVDRIKNKINDLKEGLGLKLLPKLQELADKMIVLADNPAVIKFFDDMANGIINLMDALSVLAQRVSEIDFGSMLKNFDLMGILKAALAGVGVGGLLSILVPIGASIGGGLGSSILTSLLSSLMGNANLMGKFGEVLGSIFSSKIGGGLISGFGKLSGFASILTPLAGTLTSVILPLGLMAGAILAVVGAVALFKSGALDQYLLPIKNALSLVNQVFQNMLPFLRQTGATLAGAFMTASKALAERVIPFLVTQLQKFAVWFATNRPLIERFITAVSSFFVNTLLPAIVNFWTVVQPLLGGFFDMLLGLATFVMQIATGDWAGAWESIKLVVSVAFTAIGESIVALLDWIAGLMGGSLAGIKAQWSANWNAFKQILAQVWAIIKSTVMSGVNSITNYFSNAWSNIVNGARSFASSLVNSIVSSINAAVSGVSGALNGFVSLGGRIISSIIQGLNNTKNNLLSYLRGIIEGLVSGIFGGGFSHGTVPGDIDYNPDEWTGASGSNGWLTVPQGFPNDNYHIGLTSGEKFAVVAPGQRMPTSGGGNSVTNYYNAHIVINQRKGTEPRQVLRGLV
jgi:hypothetical protein